MSICSSQSDFNIAVKKALDNYEGKNKKGYKDFMLVFSIIYLILTIWAVFLAMKIPDREHRTLHIFFAIVAGPVYLISSWL
jgi:putative exporter of polyketide antibiotics